MARRALVASSVSSISGYTWFNASTTRFDVKDYKTQTGSCGGCGLDLFGDVEGWAAVSAAESMQTPYACDGAYQCATGADQMRAAGISGGCGQCYSVRSQGYSPFGAETPTVHFYAAVVDTCAHEYNKDWCPKSVGKANSHGYEYHLNVLGKDADKLNLGDNPVVHFRPVDCPEEILKVMQTSCCDKWYKGIGCSSICPENKCSAPSPAPSPSPSPKKCDPACEEPRSCVAQADGYWAQCVDCTSKVFQKECTYMGDQMQKAAESFCNSTCSGRDSEKSQKFVVENGCRDPPTPYRGNLLVMNGCDVVANITQGTRSTIAGDNLRYDIVYELEEISRNSCSEPCLDCYYVQVDGTTITAGYGDDVHAPAEPTWQMRKADGISLNYEQYCSASSYGIESCPATGDMTKDAPIIMTFCADQQLV